MDFIDNQTRKLFHAEIITRGIDTEAQECLLKPQIIQYNPRMKKFYYKRLKVLTPKGKVPISIWRVCKPSEELRKAYETKKLAYTTGLNKRISTEIEQARTKEDNKGKENKCLVCDYTWSAKSIHRPSQCPKCGSRFWDNPTKAQQIKQKRLEKEGLV